MQWGWLTPNSPPESYKVCRIRFPDGEDWHSLVRGALFLLSQESNFESFGAISVEQTADIFRQTLFDFLEDDCMEIPVGTVFEFAGVLLPSGYLWCEGQAVSRVTYAALWSKIGVAYGQGDGSTTFNLPDRRGRVGVGENVEIEPPLERGDSGGEYTHTLSPAEIPANLPYYYEAGGNVTAHVMTATNTGQLVAGFVNPGGGGAHNNMQPYLVLKYIIKY